jgi:hypothetical protein
VPDPTKQTISATESPALFNASPYITRWLLWRRFAKGLNLDGEADERMLWGRKMQGLVVDHAAAELRLEVQHNETDVYLRRGLLGCTRDATIICPDRGPGALETKCVFDYATWMRDWNGGKQPPRHHEIQLQQQMFVGSGTVPYRWGVLVAWVAGNVHYFEREPIDEFWQKLYASAEGFFRDVEAGNEPEPFGSPVELPWLATLFPVIKGNAIDLTAAADADALAQIAVDYRNAKEQEAGGARAAEPLRAKLLAVLKDHDEATLLDGVRIRVSPVRNGKRIKVYVPDGRATLSPNSIPDDILMAG